MWYTINRIYYVGLLPLSRPLQPVIYPAIEDLMTMCSVIRSSLYNINMLTGEDMLDGIAAGTAAGVVGSHVARVTSPDDAVQLAQKDHLESIYLALAEIADFQAKDSIPPEEKDLFKVVTLYKQGFGSPFTPVSEHRQYMRMICGVSLPISVTSVIGQSNLTLPSWSWVPVDFPDNTSYLLDASAPGNSQTIWVRYTNVAPNWAYGELLPKGDYPPGAVPITATTGNMANFNDSAHLAAASGKTTYISGFEVSGSGATGALVVTVSVNNTVSGNMLYTYVFVAGVKTANTEGKKLSDAEVIRLRPKLVEYLTWQTEHLDQFIIATSGGHDPTIEIWGTMSIDEMEILADFLLQMGKTDVKAATAVRYASVLMDRVKLGLIIVPRMYHTLAIYWQRGVTIR